jgi:short-subunit dehydrogenase
LQVRTYAADLTQRSSLDALLQHLADSNTPISVLVANAGGAVPRFSGYWDFSDAEEAAMQALNGTACYLLVKRLLPGMLQVRCRQLEPLYTSLAA